MPPPPEDPTSTSSSEWPIVTTWQYGDLKSLDENGAPPGYGFSWDTTRLLRDTLGGSWDLFRALNESSDDELTYPYTSSYSHALYLIAGVCGDADSVQKNCSETCSDSSELFSSWKTLWQCLMLASLSLAGESFPGLNQSSHQRINTALSHFSIPKASEFPGEIVLNHTFECAVASCTNDTGKCLIDSRNSSYVENGHVRWDIMYEVIGGICKGIETDTNTDVAGPGVLLSYFFQMGMAVYAWLFILMPKILGAFSAIARFFRRLFHNLGFKTRTFSDRPPTSQRFEQTNLAHATSTFLVELHEAQCFFVTSIEIALLYSKSRVRSNGSNNWATLALYTETTQTIALAGAWPIILTQVSLSRARLDSIYYLILSSLALALATVTRLTATDPTVDKVYQAFEGVNTISQCGNNTSLRSFCVDYYRGPVFLFGPESFLPFLSLICILWLAKLRDVICAISWVREKCRSLTERQQSIVDWTGWALSKLSVVLFFFGELGTLVFLGFGLYQLQTLQQEDDDSDLSEWGVGQVIAVLIWAPVIFKYFYLIIFGVEKSFLYRLSRAFMVVKRPTEIMSDDEDIASRATPGVAPDATPLMQLH